MWVQSEGCLAGAVPRGPHISVSLPRDVRCSQDALWSGPYGDPESRLGTPGAWEAS